MYMYMYCTLGSVQCTQKHSNVHTMYTQCTCTVHLAQYNKQMLYVHVHVINVQTLEF